MSEIFESDEFGTMGGWANSQSDFYAPTPEEAGLQAESEFIDWQEEDEWPVEQREDAGL